MPWCSIVPVLLAHQPFSIELVKDIGWVAGGAGMVLQRGPSMDQTLKPQPGGSQVKRVVFEHVREMNWAEASRPI